MKKVISLLLVFSFHAVSFIQAQTYEEFLRQRDADFTKFRQEQQKAIDNLRKEYSQYILKRDLEYSAYLKQEWEKFQVFSGRKAPVMPKPVALPAYKPAKESPPRMISVKATGLDIPQQVISPVRIPLVQKPEVRSEALESVSFRFCGERVMLDLEQGFRDLGKKAKGKEAITAFWDEASGMAYPMVVNQLMEARSRFNMNDYGYLSLVQDLADYLYIMPEQSTVKILFTWFIMVRSGYDVRVAYNKDEIALLVPSFNTIYSKKFLTIGNLRYYFFTQFNGDEVQTYEKSYDPANTPLDFNVHSPMKFTAKPVKRKIGLTYNAKNYSFEISHDPGAVEFFRDYPQVDPEVYFNAAISLSAKQSIADAFTPVIQKMSQADAVNLLLAFVQKGFQYKTDQEQFKKEKFFFAEELFHYPAADCEDRSVLFAWLVRNLMGLKVVGLESPDHMFTAVKFTDEVFGDYVTFRGETYVVADPTYINAPCGRTMPEIYLREAKIIAMNNGDNDAINLRQAGEIALKAGIRKAGSLPNVAIDRTGDFFVTGYFHGTLNLGEFSAKGFVDEQSYIVARMNREGRTLWANHIPCTGNAAGMAVSVDGSGNVFVAGSYSGKMASLDTKGKSDVFLAMYTPAGERKWMVGGGLDSVSVSGGLTYSIMASKKGLPLQMRLTEFSAAFSNYGLFLTDTSVVYNGMMGGSMVPAESSLALNASAEIDYPELLKKEYDQYVSRQTDRAVAGLLAISNIIRNTGIVISGKDVQKAFDRYNPSFRSKCPNMYKLIGKVSFMKNANNIITITTEGGGDVLFEKLRLSNNSQMRITLLPDGNAQVDAISGVKVGKLVVWYPLNYVRIYSRTGDLLFDYDDDHSQARMNMRKDILN